jgi:hypothetical protein
MPSGVYRLRNSKKAPKSMKGIHEVVPVADTSGYNEVDFRDDTVLRKDVHPNKWSPNGANPYSPYPVIAGQGYHREMTIVGPRAEEPLKKPKYPDKAVWKARELDVLTKPPESNEEPIRGEGPPATHKRGRKGGS